MRVWHRRRAATLADRGHARADIRLFRIPANSTNDQVEHLVSNACRLATSEAPQDAAGGGPGAGGLFAAGGSEEGKRRRGQGDIRTIGHSDEEFIGSATRFVPGCRREELGRLAAEFPGGYEGFAQRSRQRAEAVLLGEWPLLGQAVDLRGGVDWHRDPKTGFTWPRDFKQSRSIIRSHINCIISSR